MTSFDDLIKSVRKWTNPSLLTDLNYYFLLDDENAFTDRFESDSFWRWRSELDEINEGIESLAPQFLGELPIIHRSEFEPLEVAQKMRRLLGLLLSYSRPATTQQDAPLRIINSTPVSVGDLLRLNKLPADAGTKNRLTKALARFRVNNPNCYAENQTRSRNEPQFLYYPDRVISVVESLRLSLECQTKNN